MVLLFKIKTYYFSLIYCRTVNILNWLNLTLNFIVVFHQRFLIKNQSIMNLLWILNLSLYFLCLYDITNTKIRQTNTISGKILICTCCPSPSLWLHVSNHQTNTCSLSDSTSMKMLIWWRNECAHSVCTVQRDLWHKGAIWKSYCHNGTVTPSICQIHLDWRRNFWWH